MDSGSSSLEKYYKDKDKALQIVKELNKYIPNLYYVNEIKLEDDE